MEIRLQRFAIAAFVVLAIFWIAMGASGEGNILLLIPGIVSLAAGGLLTIGFRREYTRILVASAGIYNFLLTAYQAYAATILLQSGLIVFASVALIGYLVAAAVSAFFALVSYSNASALMPVETESSEENKEKSD